MAPFAVVAPLIGPALDRARSGRRWMIVGIAGRPRPALLPHDRRRRSLSSTPRPSRPGAAEGLRRSPASRWCPARCSSDAELVEANSKLSLSPGSWASSAPAPAALLFKLFGAAVGRSAWPSSRSSSPPSLALRCRPSRSRPSRPRRPRRPSCAAGRAAGRGGHGPHPGHRRLPHPAAGLRLPGDGAPKWQLRRGRRGQRPRVVARLGLAPRVRQVVGRGADAHRRSWWPSSSPASVAIVPGRPAGGLPARRRGAASRPPPGSWPSTRSSSATPPTPTGAAPSPSSRPGSRSSG